MTTLGHLSLFQKRGLFYNALEVYTSDQYSQLEKTELQAPNIELKPFDRPSKQELITVDEVGTMDYITATFEDVSQANYPYDVTVWLLVEEEPIEL